MTRPKIGITPDEELRDRKGVSYPWFALGAAYARAVVAAGGYPIYLPRTDLPPEEVLEPLDGLVISGGHFDVPPELFGEPPHEKLGTTKPDRTRFEAELLKCALELDLPLLGICGGMQLINVLYGGTLFQDLSERPESIQHEQPGPTWLPSHLVLPVSGSLLARLAGLPPLPCNSTHHQAVKALGSGLQPAGFSEDGVLEAFWDPGHTFVLGVQWHPEAIYQADPRHLTLYRGLIEAAEIRRAANCLR